MNNIIREQSVSQSQLNETFANAIRALADSQTQTQTQVRETNERLNVLIGVVERLAGGGGA